ncbi:Panacea domain-containing protein [Winogradskya humida]|uniref:Antitoxin SocA-like Panacea domain-containing protein n=1 Tax=Winogradskya humida TaxID=113566 RepID=A0ABQ3ZMD6_9ACTN|nr:type II toxin-antitoxin system antitoxin SocA domain-containing protein [Actinoplanes humidus]GIE19664.1 hypothetical protein Ahu01nite_027660 [Actinoplanes humidus]
MLKAIDVAAVIEERVESQCPLDPMSLHKLLYYVQAWHLAIKGEPLFEGHFEAGPDGPVLSGFVDAGQRDPVQVDLNDQVSDLIWLVVRTYGFLSPGELTVLAKTETPWLEARGDLSEGSQSADVIDDESMARFVKSRGRLQGFSAADFALPGLYIKGYRDTRPFTVRDFVESLGPEFDDPPGPESSWPSANLDFHLYDEEESAEEHRPAEPGA